jgi:aspartyl protease family protein
MRIDLSSLGVVGLAAACSVTAAFWVSQLGDHGQAQMAVAASAAAASPNGGATGAVTAVGKSPDGHFWAEAHMDANDGNRGVRVMVDTGASLVSLTRADAETLGVHVGEGDFSGSIITASGRVRAAPVVLKSVSIGGVRVERVEALVIERGLPHSLLGMSYLGRLSAFTATPTALTLNG